mgnify:CR=1 FL=1
MDNQQETVLELGWLVGAYDGEGCISLLRRKRSDRKTRYGFSFKPHVSITNTDISFIDRVCRILTRLEIPYYVSSSNPTGRRRPYKTVLVEGLRRVMKLLPLITPYLCDEKREKAILLIEFCESRLADWHSAPFTERQLEIYRLISERNVKGSTPILRDYTRSSRSSKFPGFQDAG